jgi:hypothetical protein
VATCDIGHWTCFDFILWYIEGVLGCFFPTLLGRSQFDYFGIFYFPKSTFKVVPGETWVNEHTNFHMTLQLQSNQQMDDIQGVFFTGTSILLMWQPCIWKRWTNVVYFSENCTSLPQHNKSWTRSTTFDFTGENYNCSITLHLEPGLYTGNFLLFGSLLVPTGLQCFLIDINRLSPRPTTAIFRRFYKKLGPFYKKLNGDKFGNI